LSHAAGELSGEPIGEGGKTGARKEFGNVTVAVRT
jgi:hypothetical protein